jgi:cytoskeletal protein CcmA (bactofilin family)
VAEQIAVSEDFNKAVDQVILDSKRLHGVVNGDGLASIVTEDGSLIPSVRKALLDNLYFKTPPIAWKQGTQVSVFNQLYAFTEAGATSWWYAPTATQSTIVLQGVSPKSDPKWRAFLNQTGEDPSKKYAPIDSPKFTGNPRAPKPAKGDSSDTIPTTSWVGDAIKAIVDGQDISVKNLTVTGTTTLTGDATASKIASGEITNTGKITTKDLYVSGNFVDEDGQPVAPTMDGLDINPKNVNATGSLKGQSVTTVGGITSGGNMHSKGTLAVDGDAGVTGDFNVAGQTATVNDLVVKGSLRDGNGNPIGSAESIEGKDILPKSVTATEAVSALNLSASDSITAVGPITGESLTVTGEVNGGSLAVSGAASIEGVATVGGLTTEGSVTTNELILKRKAGQTGDKLRVEGNALVEGDLNVSGTINGEIDLSSKNITALSATVTGDIGAVNVTASNDVTAQRVVAGSADMGKVGLDVANNANVGGNLKVTGTITGQLDLSNNAVAAKTLTVTGETSLKATTVTDLTVTGDFSLANNDVVAKSLEADKVTAPKFSVTPKDVLPSSATYTPDGTTNVYNVNVQTAFAVNAPAGLVGGGKSESIYIYFEQDATGHEVTWSNSFVVHGTGTKVSTTPSSVTICNLVYRGKGNLIDVFMTTRP